MSERSEAETRKTGDSSSPEPDIERLRRLLGVADAEGVQKIVWRLDDPEARAREISSVLPDAVMLSGRRGDRLGDALEPSVQRAVHSAIHRDARPFARALYPALAPAIRRAIAEALRSMVQSLNEIITNTFSLKGIRWRLQALRSRTPFAEVVLSQSLVYRVEQVFLIHRETGLLLQYLVDSAAEAQDPDLVSSMLTAIQDFAHDSFEVSEGAGLEDFRVGDLTVWLERGREAVLAVAIRGTAPELLRSKLRQSLREVHLSHYDELAGFTGDSSAFESAKDELERCLVSSYERPSSRPSPLLWLLLLAIVAALGVWAVSEFREHRRWLGFIEALEASPGVVVTSWNSDGDHNRVHGLRDPLAVDPEVLEREHGIQDVVVEYKWEYFTSLDDDLVLQRAATVLGIPDGIELNFVDGMLNADGTAPEGWVDDAAARAPMIPGVQGFRFSGREAGPPTALVDLAAVCETRLVRFPSLSAEVLSADTGVIEDLSRDLSQLIAEGEAAGWDVSIVLVGHADSTGDEEINLDLSRKRGEALRDGLIAEGVPGDRLAVFGVGSTQPLRGAAVGAAHEDDRRVSVEIELTAANRGDAR